MKTLNTNKIGKFIRELRLENGLTQEQLADKLCEKYLSTSTKAVSDWEMGKTIPEIEKLDELCMMLGVSMDELMDGEKHKKINFLEKYSILDKDKVDKLLEDRSFNYFNMLQEQYIVVYNIINSLLKARIDREFTYNEESEFAFLIDNFYKITDYCNEYAPSNIKNPYIKLKHAIRKVILEAKNMEEKELIWEIKKFIRPIEDIDIRFFFAGDTAPEEGSMIDRRFKSLEFWQKDMILATIQTSSPLFDWSNHGSKTLKRIEERIGKPYDYEQEVKEIIKYLINNGAYINGNYLNFYRVRKENRRIIDRVEELYELCRKPLDVWVKDDDGVDHHYKVESTSLNRFLYDYNLIYSLNNTFNERSKQEWFDIIYANNDIPHNLLIEVAKKENIDLNQEWKYIEADLNFRISYAKENWTKYKSNEKKIEDGNIELNELLRKLEAGERFYQVTSKEFCGGNTVSELRECFYDWNEFFTLVEMKKSRKEKETNELLENIDKMTLEEIRNIYFKPEEVDENEE